MIEMVVGAVIMLFGILIGWAMARTDRQDAVNREALRILHEGNEKP